MIAKYKEIQILRKAGKVLGYPLYLSNPKLGMFLPSIPKGKCLHITANTNVGKSQFWKWHFLVAPFLIYKLNPEANFKPTFIIFLLEESYEQLYDQLISLFIFINHKKIVEPQVLRGGTPEIITDDELRLVEDVIPIVEELLTHCEITDHVYNPTGLYKIARKKLLTLGTRYFTTIAESDIIIPESEYLRLSGEGQAYYKFKKYIPNDEKEYVFVITDNVNLLEQEVQDGKLMNLQETIWKWSTDYEHKQLQKNFHAIVIDIIQQVGDQEKQQFTNFGSSIIEKIKPSRDGYGDNKRIARNADVILGIFAPGFYGVKSYANFDIQQYGDYFRSVIVLKNRLGKGFKEIPLFFNGAVNYFAELPAANQLTTTERDLIIKGHYQKGFLKLR